MLSCNNADVVARGADAEGGGTYAGFSSSRFQSRAGTKTERVLCHSAVRGSERISWEKEVSALAL